jgi:hypothetical protein
MPQQCYHGDVRVTYPGDRICPLCELEEQIQDFRRERDSRREATLKGKGEDYYGLTVDHDGVLEVEGSGIVKIVDDRLVVCR